MFIFKIILTLSIDFDFIWFFLIIDDNNKISDKSKLDNELDNYFKSTKETEAETETEIELSKEETVTPN